MLECDRSRKANRRDTQSICRIQETICQSYFIFDYPEFYVARAFYYEGLSTLSDIKSTRVRKFSELLKNTEESEQPDEDTLAKALRDLQKIGQSGKSAASPAPALFWVKGH